MIPTDLRNAINSTVNKEESIIMNQFNMMGLHRFAEQLEEIAQEMKSNGNTPEELQHGIEKIRSIMNSMETQVNQARELGSNPRVTENEIR
jgi:uncharacterized phage infection (PIP) family protein YhgE